MSLITYRLFGAECSDWQPNCACDVMAMEAGDDEYYTVRPVLPIGQETVLSSQ